MLSKKWLCLLHQHNNYQKAADEPRCQDKATEEKQELQEKNKVILGKQQAKDEAVKIQKQQSHSL